MARKTEKPGPPPSEQELRDEMQKALNSHLHSTFLRIQNSYAGIGTRMAEAANVTLQDQDFVSFLFCLYNSSSTLLQATRHIDEHDAYPQAMLTALLLHKWETRSAINAPCHIEDILVENRYLRRFVRELFRDIYAANNQESTNPE